MLNALGNIFRIPELRKKILTTLGLLIVYRIGSHVPLPGVDVDAVRNLPQQGGAFGAMLGMFNTLSGGSLGNLVLFSLGIMPYISASIIFSLLTKVVPALEKLSKEGPSGYKKINQYTRYATVPLCIIQAFFIVKGVIPQLLSMDAAPVIDPDLFYTFRYQAMAVLALTSGGIFLMWLGEQITEYGIGNGISLLIMCGIVAEIPVALRDFVFQPGYEPTRKIQIGILMTLLFLGMIVVVVLITKAHRRIPIQQARVTRGRRVMGGQRHYLPIKVNQAGVMPVIFASSLLILPGILFSAIGVGFLERLFSTNSFWYITFYVGLIFFFSFFWTTLMIQPTEWAKNLKEHGSFIPGIRPGRRTSEYLEGIMIRITLVGAAFLAFIALLPQLASEGLGVQQIFTRFLGGTSILIVVGVALDLVDKINSHLLMRDYEGFMRRGRGSTKR
jgi:preprotein translocase subunit SecY